MVIGMLPIARIIIDRNADCLGNGVDIGTDTGTGEWVNG